MSVKMLNHSEQLIVRDALVAFMKACRKIADRADAEGDTAGAEAMRRQIEETQGIYDGVFDLECGIAA